MEENNRPLVLVSNDDGINAKGIRFLVECLSKQDNIDIIVVAPDTVQSGKSSAITCNTPLRFNSHPDFLGAKMYSVNGTPVDCVKLAMHTIVPRTPDFIVSGINHGYNSGSSTVYSGTMGVVFEGCLLGIPSVGFSFGAFEANANFDVCAQVINTVMSNVFKKGIPNGVCLNVNIPPVDKLEGIIPAKLAPGHWVGEYEERIDPYGEKYYWLTGRYQCDNDDDLTGDVQLLRKGYATVTPCTPDRTEHNFIEAAEEYVQDAPLANSDEPIDYTSRLVRIGTFSNNFDAEVASHVLNENGIKSIIPNGIIASVYPIVNFAEVDLMVMEQDLEAARKILEETNLSGNLLH